MKKYLSNFDLKLIALITMTIDHIGVVFGTPFYYALRIVGRISFPIFAFLLTEGYLHTKKFSRYLLRLVVLAIISEVIYDYVFYDSFFYLEANNVFFTLVLGLVTLKLLDISKKTITKYVQNKLDYYIALSFVTTIILILMGLMATIFHVSYGMLGIVMISSFYLFKDKPVVLVLAILVATLLLAEPIQLFSLLSFLCLYFYNQKLGKQSKFFFYLYYPAHILVLGIIKLLLSM